MKTCHKYLISILFVLATMATSSAQDRDLNYLFDKGQTLEYDYLFEDYDTVQSKVSKTEIQFKLLFRVNSIKQGQYNMSLKIQDGFRRTQFLDGYDNRPDQYSSIMDSSAMSYVRFVDVNRDILFDMDFKGKVTSIYGLDALKEEVINFVKSERPDWKHQIPYVYIDMRINPQYYRSLINGAFPVLPNIDGPKKARFGPWVCRNDSIYEIFGWDMETILKGDLTALRFRRQLELQNGQNKFKGLSSTLPLIDDVNGTAKWDGAAHNFETVSSQGIELWSFFNAFLYNYYAYYQNQQVRSSLFYRNLRTGSITTTRIREYHEDQINTRIIGEIKGCKDCEIVAEFPSTKIRREQHRLKLNNKSGRVEIEGDLPYGPDMVIINFTPKNKDRNASYWNDPRQLRLFVRPGDTIKFSVDLRNFGHNMGFYGTTWKEQEVLNSYIAGFTPQHPRVSLEILQSTRKQLEQKLGDYCVEFQNWFAFELKYQELTYELLSMINEEPEVSQEDLGKKLPEFLKHRNNPEGYKSEAYKDFISQLPTAFSAATQSMNQGSYYFSKQMQSINMVLEGWDQYYVMANMIMGRVYSFHDPLSRAYINEFLTKYKSSLFGREIEELYAPYRDILPGKAIEDLSFKDVQGKKHQLFDYRGKVIYITPLESLEPPRYIRFPITEEQKKRETEGLIRIYYYVGDETPSRTQLDSLGEWADIYVVDAEEALKLRKRFANRTDLGCIIDRDQRYSSFFPMNIHGSAGNELGWPQLEFPERETKQVSRLVLWLSLTAVILLGFIIFMLIKRRNKRQEAKQILKRRMAELELDAVKARMNPHFLFNALSSIQNLMNKGDIEKANKYLAKFAKLIRRILEQSNQQHISLSEEIETLNLYIELEQLRQNFTCRIAVDPKLDTDGIDIPPLLIQPHIENALIHGIAGMDDAGMIEIEFSRDNGNLLVVISDNGIGIKKSRPLDSNGLGQGWKLTQQRIDLLNRTFEGRIRVEIIEPKGKTGTTIQFVLPIE